MRRAPHEGQNPRRLQLNASSFVVAAVAAAQAQEAVGQDAAFEEGVELVFDEMRQVGPGGHLCLGDEGSGVLLHQAVQRGLFRAVTLVMDRGAIRRPAGAAGRWLARQAPEAVSPHGLKPCTASESLRLPPTRGCLPLWGPVLVIRL